MASNSAEMDGKTFVEINEWSESDDAELGSDDWAIAVMAMQSALGVEVKGYGAQGDEEWEDEEAGWTGSQSLGDKEWTISASRPLASKPVLASGDEAFHTFAVMYPDETNEAGMGVFGPKASAFTIGSSASSASGAAALVAGATLAASMLF